ncbi:MAG: deaminase [Epsilonproteobacteria bacterium]|nr:MAG: deaminase [Campylobacterota bacterium]
MKCIVSKEAAQAIGPYSQAIEARGMIYTSGQIALTAEGKMLEADIKIQTHQVMKNLSCVLDAAGAHLSDVIKTTIFLTDMDDFAKVNEIYAYYFSKHKPVRSTVAVKTLPKNALIEIDCIALAGTEYSY